MVLINWVSFSVITNRETSCKIREAFAKQFSGDWKLSKTEISKIIQLGIFLGDLAALGKLVGPLMKFAWSLVASAADACIQKKIHGSGTTLKYLKKSNKFHENN